MRKRKALASLAMAAVLSLAVAGVASATTAGSDQGYQGGTVATTAASRNQNQTCNGSEGSSSATCDGIPDRTRDRDRDCECTCEGVCRTAENQEATTRTRAQNSDLNVPAQNGNDQAAQEQARCGDGQGMNGQAESGNDTCLQQRVQDRDQACDGAGLSR